MKRALLLLVLFAVLVPLAAQGPARVNVRGMVYERESLDPLPGATVQLLDTLGRLQSGALTQKNGQYLLPDVVTGRYTLKISFVGFQPQAFTLRLPEKGGNYKVNDVLLKEAVTVLTEAVVTAQAAEMTVVEDTVVYNASAFTVPEGALVEELIKKLPGVVVDESGNYTVNGKPVTQILVDGKDFFGKDKEVVLKNLTADVVDKVKAYDKQSDLARITGIDDGEEKTVLDLTIKKEKKRGWFGNVKAGGGTNERYSGRGMANHFVGERRMSAVANISHNGGAAMRAAQSGGVNFSFANRKIETGGSVHTSFSQAGRETTSSSQSFENTRAAYANRASWSRNRSGSLEWDYKIEWRPDTLTHVLLKPNLSWSNGRNRSGSESASFDDDPYAQPGITDPLAQLAWLKEAIGVNHNLGANSSRTSALSAGASLQVNRRLRKEGRNLTLNLNADYGRNTNESDSYSQIDYYRLLAASGGDSVYHKIQYNDAPQAQHTLGARLSYSEPLGYKIYLQLSYNVQYRFQERDRSVRSLFDPLVERLGAGVHNYGAWWPWATPDIEQCNYVENRYLNHDARVQIRINRTTYRLTAGVNLQPQYSRTQYDKGTRHYDIDRSVLNVAPTFNFRYRFSQQETLEARYNGSTGQPSITDLIPDTLSNANPLNIRLGNAGLKPSFTHRLTASYNRGNRDRQRSLSANASFRTTQNSVSSRTEYNATTGGRVTRPENINGNWNASGNLNFNTAFRDTRFRIHTQTGVNHTHDVGYVYQSSTKQTVKNSTATTHVSETLRGTFRTERFECTAHGNFRYNRSRASATSAGDLDTWHYGYGLSLNANTTWGLYVSTDLTESSRRGYSDAAMNTNQFVWNMHISQRFLKKKNATVGFHWYDILRQRDNVSRSISATQRTDTSSSETFSYCTLDFSYRFNLFGGKGNRGRTAPDEEAGEGRTRRERGGNRDRGNADRW